ncbi:hypothetical protein [Brumimicrobium aurantiacum]|uniref:Uncharacterized protein n=1 Tax=Brumimicrobium aurantiacum TaxID=1737063 RepID=A0A3E1EZ73_9FLAO|nr:hypothetical protein [Brumimicrobium aurantiacum]RFC54854.1 hypothetical protein DXU93_03270 [Brumimicrobium aurantiacum]
MEENNLEISVASSIIEDNAAFVQHDDFLVNQELIKPVNTKNEEQTTTKHNTNTNTKNSEVETSQATDMNTVTPFSGEKNTPCTSCLGDSKIKKEWLYIGGAVLVLIMFVFMISKLK